ncbi:MAG: 50S ribosomal protein L11 methyltransferase [Kiritimatiellae bacterium]|nr:50S ribosomal protein L11 methyltransferase [Kiritimatiellia bacterium]
MGATLQAVTAEIPRGKIDEVADTLTGRGVFFSTWEDCEGGPSRISTYIPDDPASPDWAPYRGMLFPSPGEAAEVLADVCAECGVPAVMQVTEIRQEDWAESWKRFFTTIRVSPRLTVRPPWEDYSPAPGERVLVLDPGMSFGTGRHATTQACLQLLDALAVEDPRRAVLDIGCGSGILSIAASLLGFQGVRGIDNDPDAVRIAAENAAANGAAADFSTCDLAACTEKAPVVVANVLATVLEKFAGEVAGCVARVPGCALILSGILDAQYDAVRRAYAALGAAEENSVLIGEWRTGLFRFEADAPRAGA